MRPLSLPIPLPPFTFFRGEARNSMPEARLELASPEGRGILSPCGPNSNQTPTNNLAAASLDSVSHAVAGCRMLSRNFATDSATAVDRYGAVSPTPRERNEEGQ